MLVAAAAAAPAQAFPQWEVKPPPAFALLPWNTPLKVTPGATSIKIVIDGEINKCVLKGDAEPVENTGGHGYLDTKDVNGGCNLSTGSTGSHECTPASSLKVIFKTWQAELVEPITNGHAFALSTSITEVDVSCSSGIPARRSDFTRARSNQK